MSQNIQATSAPDLERQAEAASKVSGIAASWIAAADSKATGLLAVAGVLLGAVIAFQLPDGFGGLERAFYLTAGFSALLSVGCSAFVLMPRTDRKSILLGRKGRTESGVGAEWPPLARSSTFFGDLAPLSFTAFTAAIVPSKDDQNKNIIEQAYVIIIIAHRKMRWMKFSIWFILGALTCLAVLVISLAVRGIASKSDLDSSVPRSNQTIVAPGDEAKSKEMPIGLIRQARPQVTVDNSTISGR